VFCNKDGENLTLFDCKQCGNKFHHVCAGKRGFDSMNWCGCDASEDRHDEDSEKGQQSDENDNDDEAVDPNHEGHFSEVDSEGFIALPAIATKKSAGQGNIAEHELTCFFKHVERVLPYSSIEWGDVVDAFNKECETNYSVDSMSRRFQNLCKPKEYKRKCKSFTLL
jgi:hypothetical protein